MQNEKNIIFPSETMGLISEILRSFNMEENDAQMYEKIVSGQKSVNATIAYLVKKKAIDSIDLSEMIETIKQDLKISPEVAEQIAKELNEKIIPLGKEEIFFEQTSNSQKEVNVQSKDTLYPPIRKRVDDAYKEPLE